jgi:uncharacterized protein YyaL (SSP411 family)
MANRGLEHGGFRHDEHDPAGQYLGDTLAMGQGFLALYRASGDKRWLHAAEEAESFIAANFGAQDGVGYRTAKQPADRFSRSVVERDENVALVRFSKQLLDLGGDATAKAVVDQGMRYLVTPAIAVRPLSGGELLAVYETTHAAAGKVMEKKPAEQAESR